MNVKISVKKLNQMLGLISSLKDCNARYLDENIRNKVLHEKEIKLLEQRNDALDKQWHQQEMQINGLVDENDTLKVKIKDLNVLHEKEMIKLIDQRNDALDKYYEALKLPSTQQKALKRIQTSPYPVFERGEEDES